MTNQAWRREDNDYFMTDCIISRFQHGRHWEFSTVPAFDHLGPAGIFGYAFTSSFPSRFQLTPGHRTNTGTRQTGPMQDSLLQVKNMIRKGRNRARTQTAGQAQLDIGTISLIARNKTVSNPFGRHHGTGRRAGTLGAPLRQTQ